MSLITIGSDLVDVCDIAIVASSGSTCVVYFQDGTYISSELTAAAQSAAVNGAGDGALLTTVVTSSNFGSCYVAGQQVKRVRAAGANSVWELWSGLGPVLVSGVDVAAAGALINATGECGGGGGAARGYTNIGVWIPNVTDPNATTVYGAPFVPAPWVRIGPADANGPAAGDYVRCGLVVPFSGEVVGDQPIVVVSDFPFPLADAGAFSCAAMLLVDTQPGVSIGVASPPFGGQVFFQMQGVAVGPFAGVLSLEITFQVDAS